MLEIIYSVSWAQWCLLVISISFLLWRKYSAPFRRYSHLPQVKPNWFLGNRDLGGISFTDVILNHYDALDKHRFGLFWEGNEPAVFIKDLELLKKIQVSDFDHFTDLGFNRPDYLERVGNVFGIADLQGESWRRIKKMVQPPFSVPRLKKTLQSMNIAGRRLRDYLTSLEEQESVNVVDFCRKFYMTTVASVAFGLDIDCFAEKESDFEVKGKTLISVPRFLLIELFPNLAIFFKVKAINPESEKFFSNLCKRIVRERHQMQVDEKDILGNLMKVGEENSDMTEEMMYKTCVQFFTDGYETASQAIGMLFYHLARNPEIQERAQDEIDGVFEDNDAEDITVEDINGLTYLDQVLNEGLRVGAVPFTARYCTKPWQVPGDNFLIPKGMKVIIPIAGLHYDPNYWEEPWKFDPERFHSENKSKIEGMAYQPFGSGPRICLGQNLMRLETKIMLAHILRNFSLKKYGDMPEKMKFDPEAFVGSSKINVKILRRENI